MKRNLPLIIIAGVLVLAFGTAILLYKTMKPAEGTSPSAKTSGTPSLPGADPPHVRGEATAPVTIEEYGDFECPPCGALFPELLKIKNEYGDKLRVVFREFPLTIHKHAYDAARAAEAAGAQGKFWEMHDLLYEKKEEWANAAEPREAFAGYAKSLGLDVDRFKADMPGQAASARVALDMRRGRSMGVIGTPTLFINGRKMDATEITPEGIRAAINTVLYEKAQAGK